MITPIEILVEVLAFLVVTVIAIAAINGAVALIAVRRRLGGRQARASEPVSSLIPTQNVTHPLLQWVQSATLPGDASEGEGETERDLSLAGFDSPAASIWYVIIRLCLAIGVPTAFLVGESLLSICASGGAAILIPLGLCAAGMFAPRMYLNHTIAARREALEMVFRVRCSRPDDGLRRSGPRPRSGLRPRRSRGAQVASPHLSGIQPP